MTLLRRCSKCGVEKPASLEFFSARKHRSGNIGFQSVCRQCVRENSAKWYARNRERHMANGRKAREANPEIYRRVGRRAYEKNRELYLERSRVWHRENREHKRNLSRALVAADPEHYRNYARNYQIANRERRAEKMRLWRANNPEKAALYSRVSHSRRRERVGSDKFGSEEVRLKMVQQKNKCYWCGKKVGADYHIDHIIALSRGGKNTAANICIACPDCNLRKYNFTPWDFAGRLL